jgi:hypothetical protein
MRVRRNIVVGEDLVVFEMDPNQADTFPFFILSKPVSAVKTSALEDPFDFTLLVT